MTTKEYISKYNPNSLMMDYFKNHETIERAWYFFDVYTLIWVLIDIGYPKGELIRIVIETIRNIPLKNGEIFNDYLLLTSESLDEIQEYYSGDSFSELLSVEGKIHNKLRGMQIITNLLYRSTERLGILTYDLQLAACCASGKWLNKEWATEGKEDYNRIIKWQVDYIRGKIKFEDIKHLF